MALLIGVASSAGGGSSIWGQIDTPTTGAPTVYCGTDTAATRGYIQTLARTASTALPMQFTADPQPPAGVAVATSYPGGQFTCDGLQAGTYVVFSHLYGVDGNNKSYNYVIAGRQRVGQGQTVRLLQFRDFYGTLAASPEAEGIPQAPVPDVGTPHSFLP